MALCNGWAKYKFKVLSSLSRLGTADRYIFKNQPLQIAKRWQQSIFERVRQLFISTLILMTACDSGYKDRLFETLIHRTFVPKDGVTIEFVDSTYYVVEWGQDSARKSEKKVWSIENGLTGTVSSPETWATQKFSFSVYKQK